MLRRLCFIFGGNGKFSSKCNFILTLFYGEKRSKSRSRDYSPLDNPPTGGFCPEYNILPFQNLYPK